MRPAMRDTEIALLACVLRCSSRYVEFGSGGSSILAAQLVHGEVICIDSSKDWLDKVVVTCVENGFTVPTTLFANIGPVRAFGFPSGTDHAHLWPNYHAEVWGRDRLTDADAYLVDGRFRIACFLQTMLRCDGNAVVLVHDFSSRPQYHVMRAFAREVARADDLSVFQRNIDFDAAAADACLRNHAFDPR